jgi:hypothetical protein
MCMGFIHGVHRHEALLCPERLDDSMAAAQPVRFLDACVAHRTRTLLGCQRATPAATAGLGPGGAGAAVPVRRSLPSAGASSSGTGAPPAGGGAVAVADAAAGSPDDGGLPEAPRAAPAASLPGVHGVGHTAGPRCGGPRRHRRQAVPRRPGPSAPLHRRHAHTTPGAARPAQRGLAPGPGRAGSPSGGGAPWRCGRRAGPGDAGGAPAASASRCRCASPVRRALPRGKGRGMAGGSHGQPAVDSQPKRRGANDVPTDTGARACLSPMALPATALLGSPCEAVAAGGDDHGEAITTGRAAGILPDVARPITAAQAKLGLVSKAACREAQATAPYRGPASARRPCRLDAGEPGRPRRSEAPAACGGWARQPPCTRSQGGRRMPRGGAAPLVAAMAQRVRSQPEGMKQRTPLVAHPCGTMPRWWEAGACLRRGREQVRTAFRWTVLAYHRWRGVNRGAMPRRLAARG